MGVLVILVDPVDMEIKTQVVEIVAQQIPQQIQQWIIAGRVEVAHTIRGTARRGVDN